MSDPFVMVIPQILLQIGSITVTLHLTASGDCTAWLVFASGSSQGPGAPAQVKGRGAKPKYICSTPQEAIAKRYCQYMLSRADFAYPKLHWFYVFLVASVASHILRSQAHFASLVCKIRSCRTLLL